MPSTARVVLLGLSIAIAASSGPVRVWQDSIELPTYDERDPDPAPEFPALKPDLPNFPYPVRSKISARPEDRSTAAWRTLNLENEYLFCRILPDLGGHVYNCRDKLSQREVFYANPVIKKDLIGLRGAWIATGIEPNFPATHSRVSAAPVNFFIRSDADGSASVIVGDTDRVTGMSWRVEYRLRPESTVLEEQVSLYNPTPVRHPYLWWSNAEIELDDPGLRYVVPTKLMLSHDRKTLESWPVNSAGIDMSLFANHKTEAAWFAYLCQEAFMAIYKPKSRTGVAHYADPKVVAGKKVWIMGDQAEYYRGHLTDNANVYAEMQAGLFADQQTYEFLQPGQSRTFTEDWISFRDLDGVTRATPDAVLYAQRAGGQELRIELDATHPVAEARIRVISGAKAIAEFTADLDPKAAWKQTVKLSAGASYAVQVLDRTRHVLLEHEEGLYAAAGPAGLKLGPQKTIDWNARLTEWKLRERGEYNESVSQNAFARYDYTGGLKAFSGDPAFDKAEGRLAVSLLRFDEASELLEKLAGAPRPDPEVLYYAGVAQSLAGHDEAARALLRKAASSPQFGAAAAVELALIASRAHDFREALKLPDPVAGDPLDAARIGGIRAALLRRNGDRAGAVRELDKWRAVAPEDPFLRYEGTLAGREDPALWSYLAGDAERVLNLADEYLRLGMWEDAVACLKHDFSKDDPKFLEPGAVPPDRSALLAYYRAYCEIELKMDPAADLRRASELGTRYMFPNRATSFAVLRAAIERNPSDATAHALMGNLDMDSFRVDEAIAEWQRAVTLNPGLEVERADIVKATELQRRKPEPILITKPAASPNPVRREIAKAVIPAPSRSATSASAGASATASADSALLSSVTGSADSAAEVFRGAEFAPEKQPPSVRQAYIEVQLQGLLALSLAGKCDALEDRIEGLPILEDPKIAFTFHGFSDFMKAAHFSYYLGVAEANCGRLKEARKYWSRAAKMKEPASSPDFEYPVLAASKLDPAQSKGAIANAMTALEGQGALDAGLRALHQAMLLRASGQEGPAAGEFGKALQSKDVMVQYLAEIELAGKQR